MAASLVSVLLAAVKAALWESTPAGRRVERARVASVAVADCPAISILRARVEHDRAAPENDQITVGFDLLITAAGATPEAAEEAADALHVAAHAALLASTALTAMGRDTLRCTGTDVDADSLESAVVALTAHYQIDAWVLRADLTTPA